MPHKFEWIVPQRVLFGRIWGDPTRDEIRQLSPEINREAATGQSPVHLIIDMTELTRTPFKLTELNSYVSRENLEFFGWCIVVSNDPVGRFLSATLAQIVRLRVRVFHSREAAFRFLKDMDSTLPDLTAIDVSSRTEPRET